MGHSKRTLSDLEGILTLKKNRLPSEPSGEREIKIHVITSFPNPGPLVINPFSHGNNYFFSCVFYFKSKEHGLAFCLPMACILLVPFFFFWLFLGVALNRIKIVSFTPILRMLLGYMKLFNTAITLYCLS